MDWETGDGRDELNENLKYVRVNPGFYAFPLMMLLGFVVAITTHTSDPAGDIGALIGVGVELVIVTALSIVSITGRGWWAAPILIVIYLAEMWGKYVVPDMRPNTGWLIAHIAIGAALFGGAYYSIRIRQLRKLGVTPG